MPWDSWIAGDVTPEQVVTAIGFIVGGFVLGIVMGRVLLGRLGGLAWRTQWLWCEVVVYALRGMPAIWMSLVGLYAAAQTLPLGAAAFETVETVLVVAAILSVSWATARFVAALIHHYAMRAEGLLPATSIFTNIAVVFVAAIGVLVALQYLGISITPVLTALGVGGLAVALALQDTLSNLFAGFHLIASRQVRPGDYIQLESGEEGNVVDITWRNTTVRTLTNNTVVIPNARLAGANFTNYHLPEPEMSLIITVGVAYDSDLEQVEALAVEVAQETMEHVIGGQPVFEPVVRFHTFDDSSINFNVVLRVREFVDGYLIKHEFVKRLKRRFDTEGVEIPFPIRTVEFKEGPLPAVGAPAGEA